MSSNINFHIHTTHSDGGNSPAEIVAMLKAAGVTAFSITDHDNIDGNVEAAALAKEYGLTHINGIELSCSFADGEIGLDESWVVHILGFGIDLDLMRVRLSELENRKHMQLLELFNLLVADGYNIEFEKILQDGKIPERAVISKELIRNGYAADSNECFSKILNTERYRSFAKFKPTIKEGIEIIHACGGLAVWAHPFEVTRGGKKDLTEEQVSELLKKMLEYKIDGMEVYYQQYTPEQISRLNSLAEFYRLYKTVGTDYHNSPVDLTKYPEYAEVKKRERIAFDVVEPDAGVEAILGRIMSPHEKSYPDKNIHTYKRYRFECKECDWKGIGEELIDIGDDGYSAFVFGCPVCRKLIEFIYFPHSSQILKFGSTEDKEKAKKDLEEYAQFEAEWDKEHKEYPNLSSPEQLPDIDAADIIISLREEGPKTKGSGCKFIVLYYGETEIWRELNSFEFYREYLSIGKILKTKYGDRLSDFEVEYTWALGGDSMSAFKKVRAFRKSLSGKDDMRDEEFDYITKSGWFSPNDRGTTLWKALEFAKERHSGQFLDDGTPYFEHIESVIEILRKCGHIHDYTFTVAALHDVLKAPKTTSDDLHELFRDDILNHGKSPDVIADVELLTHKDGDSFKAYIDRIFDDNSIKRKKWYSAAKYVMLADRLHNLSTLHLCGDPEKIQRIILETEEIIMPHRDKHKGCEALFALIEDELESLKKRRK